MASNHEHQYNSSHPTRNSARKVTSLTSSHLDTNKHQEQQFFRGIRQSGCGCAAEARKQLQQPHKQPEAAATTSSSHMDNGFLGFSKSQFKCSGKKVQMAGIQYS